MPRAPRAFECATSYHVTVRCNSQAFDLRGPQARKALLLCLEKARAKFGFTLFAVCVMSNHVHYLIRPALPADMPRLMHWLNWYSAMLLNRLLRRRGHFWEQRYHAAAVPDKDKFVKTKRNSHRLVVAGCCLLDPPPAEIPTEVRFSKTRIVTHDPKPPVEFLQSRRSNGLKEKCYLFSWQRSYEKTPTLTNIGSNRKSDWNLLCKASRWEPTPASSKHSCRLPH